MAKTTKYDVEAVTVEKLLVPESVSLKVPHFQRHYSWGSEEVSQLLEDLFGDDDWQQPFGDDAPYFLGSMVLVGDTESFWVLDGQQRLITVSLLLVALKDKLAQYRHSDAQELNKYLTSGRLGMKKSTKLTLQPEDHDVYKDLIEKPSLSQDKRFKRNALAQALKRIGNEIDRHAERSRGNGRSYADIYELMASRVMYHVEFVRIVAPSEGEAFKLFETLNDRGLALNAADLIKNKLFSQCGEFTNDAIETWRDIVDLVGEAEIVNFLRYYWIAFKGEARKKNLYDLYQKELDQKKGKEAFAFAEEIKSAAEHYQHIAKPDVLSCPWGSDVGETLERLATFRSRSCRPLLLVTARFHHQYMAYVARACESITVRSSMVAEQNPNQLEKAYGKLCHRIRANTDASPEYLNVALYEFFPEIPDDKYFVDLFSQIEIDNVTSAWRAILLRLNDFISTGETRIEGPRKVHIEHIFPRNPSAKAYEESGISPEDAPNYTGRIGNLTLLQSRKNQKISNGPFSAKQSAFSFSEVALNRDVAEREKWGIEEIIERSRSMAETARTAWPWPVQIPL